MKFRSMVAEDFKENAVKALNPLPPLETKIRNHPNLFLLGGAAIGALMGVLQENRKKASYENDSETEKLSERDWRNVSKNRRSLQQRTLH